jgi:hypothetical protein
LLLLTLMPAPGWMRTVTPVLPAAAAIPVRDGFGRLESHVADSPLTGARLSQLPSADGTRNRHVTPIVNPDKRLVRDNGKRSRRIFGGSLFAVSVGGFPSVEYVLRFGNLVKSDSKQSFENAGSHNGQGFAPGAKRSLRTFSSERAIGGFRA